MRIAIFSDIHANLPALTAVLADIDQQRVDRIYHTTSRPSRTRFARVNCRTSSPPIWTLAVCSRLPRSPIATRQRSTR
jgi:Calcineurin-like phosphoesterase superfamily domain